VLTTGSTVTISAAGTPGTVLIKAWPESSPLCTAQRLLTVIGIERVLPDTLTRAIYSTLHDDTYPSAHQTADGRITITAIVAPRVAGVTVYFRLTDPDDQSP